MEDLPVETATRLLYVHYARMNREKFGGVLPSGYRIVFNPRLRRLTGRITYASRLIEIASFHFSRYGIEDAKATLEHEMLHLYLHVLGYDSGHTARFKTIAARLGIRVYHSNPYQRNREPRDRYLYRCPECDRMVFRRRPLGEARLACGPCCRTQNDGFWADRFQLVLLHKVRFV
jgi:SprT-like protein